MHTLGRMEDVMAGQNMLLITKTHQSPAKERKTERKQGSTVYTYIPELNYWGTSVSPSVRRQSVRQSVSQGGGLYPRELPIEPTYLPTLEGDIQSLVSQISVEVFFPHEPLLASLIYLLAIQRDPSIILFVRDFILASVDVVMQRNGFNIAYMYRGGT